MSNKSTERKWDREEVVILVVEYFRTKNLSSDEINQTHQEISDFLRQREEILTGVPVSDIFRNYAGIHMQSGRIRCIDPVFFASPFCRKLQNIFVGCCKILLQVVAPTFCR